ncbi:MAG: hypothetical protein H6697_02675 [Myxococcales bacterium]|nr:hypothetical protein [Myxococcales bacterium]MCB9521356.1 hypothetical protein [Myxococcales bacterium]
MIESAGRTPRVVFTGFGPFGDVEWNPSGDVARYAAAVVDASGAASSRAELLSVEWGVARSFRAPEADLLISVGVAATRPCVTVELRGLNRAEAGVDVAGVACSGPLREGGAPELWAPLAPILREALEAELGEGVPPSSDAGGYICNALLYACQAEAAAGTGPPMVFVHVPSLDAAGAARVGRALGAATLRLLAAAPGADPSLLARA